MPLFLLSPDNKPKTPSPLADLTPTDKLARTEEFHNARMGNVGARISTGTGCSDCDLADFCASGAGQCHADLISDRQHTNELTTEFFRKRS